MLCDYRAEMNAGDNAIALIGFMGAGKSAVGRELSRRTGWPRHDTDERIREKFGISIPDIFARHGEPAFRDAETALLKTLNADCRVLSSPEEELFCAKRMCGFCADGRIIWLDADEEILWQRASRHSLPVPCSKHPTRERDLPSCCGNDYRAIRRRRIIASTPHAAASRQ